jgi:hypothetical protein
VALTGGGSVTGAGTVRRLALAIGALGIAALCAPSALAQTEVIPSEPVLENPIKKAKKLVNAVAEKADEVVADTQETVEYVSEEVVQDVEDTVDHARDEVDDVVDGVLGDRSPGTSQDPSPRRDAPPRPEKKLPIAERPDARDATVGGRRAIRNEFARSAVEPVTSRAVRVADFAAPPPESPSSVTPSEAARSLAFPLLMIAAVVAYLLFQGRFDRRDPKLMFHVDLDGERLSFE